MRTLSDLQKTNSVRFFSDTVESVGDESLISDIRNRVRPTELVERKLQIALQCSRNPGGPVDSEVSN